jgi:excisionase family DNA binding protein
MTTTDHAASGNLCDGRRLITVPQAAMMLGISERHLRNEIAAGRMPGHRMGEYRGVIKIVHPDGINAYLAATAIGPSAA